MSKVHLAYATGGLQYKYCSYIGILNEVTYCLGQII